MNPVLTGFTSTIGLVVFVFLFALAILWIILPFSIFGIKPLLRNMHATQKDVAEELRQQKFTPKGKTKKCPDCAEWVKREARVCRFCRHEFETI